MYKSDKTENRNLEEMTENCYNAFKYSKQAVHNLKWRFNSSIKLLDMLYDIIQDRVSPAWADVYDAAEITMCFLELNSQLLKGEIKLFDEDFKYLSGEHAPTDPSKFEPAGEVAAIIKHALEILSWQNKNE
jgi:hypothetical protein